MNMNYMFLGILAGTGLFLVATGVFLKTKQSDSHSRYSDEQDEESDSSHNHKPTASRELEAKVENLEREITKLRVVHQREVTELRDQNADYRRRLHKLGDVTPTGSRSPLSADSDSKHDGSPRAAAATRTRTDSSTSDALCNPEASPASSSSSSSVATNSLAGKSSDLRRRHYGTLKVKKTPTLSRSRLKKYATLQRDVAHHHQEHEASVAKRSPTNATPNATTSSSATASATTADTQMAPPEPPPKPPTLVDVVAQPPNSADLASSSAETSKPATSPPTRLHRHTTLSLSKPYNVNTEDVSEAAETAVSHLRPSTSSTEDAERRPIPPPKRPPGAPPPKRKEAADGSLREKVLVSDTDDVDAAADGNSAPVAAPAPAAAAAARSPKLEGHSCKIRSYAEALSPKHREGGAPEVAKKPPQDSDESVSSTNATKEGAVLTGISVPSHKGAASESTSISSNTSPRGESKSKSAPAKQPSDDGEFARPADLPPSTRSTRSRSRSNSGGSRRKRTSSNSSPATKPQLTKSTSVSKLRSLTRSPAQKHLKSAKRSRSSSHQGSKAAPPSAPPPSPTPTPSSRSVASSPRDSARSGTRSKAASSGTEAASLPDTSPTMSLRSQSARYGADRNLLSATTPPSPYSYSSSSSSATSGSSNSASSHSASRSSEPKRRLSPQSNDERGSRRSGGGGVGSMRKGHRRHMSAMPTSPVVALRDSSRTRNNASSPDSQRRHVRRSSSPSHIAKLFGAGGGRSRSPLASASASYPTRSATPASASPVTPRGSHTKRNSVSVSGGRRRISDAFTAALAAAPAAAPGVSEDWEQRERDYWDRIVEGPIRPDASVASFDPFAASSSSASSLSDSATSSSASLNDMDTTLPEDRPFDAAAASASLSLTKSESSASASSSRANATPPVFELLVTSHIDILHIMKTCHIEELSRNLHVIVDLINSTPLWLDYHRRMAMLIIRERAIESTFLQQRIYYAQQCAVQKGHFVHLIYGIEDSFTFFMNFFRQKRVKGYEVEVAKDSMVFHPFCDVEIRKARVERVMNSNARPLVIKLWPRSPGLTDLVLFKHGDDLRRDSAVMSMFKLFNMIWRADHPSEDPIEARTYDVMAMNNEFGAVQFIRDCIPLQQISQLIKDGSHEQTRLINTAAGGTIAAFVLGIKDRHDDNTLIGPDGCMFQIDFSYMLGQKVSIDTAEIAITRDTQKYLGPDGWETFVGTCLQAFVSLRNHYELITSFGLNILAPLFSDEQVKSTFKRSFFLSMSQREAVAKLEQMLHKAPKSRRTQFKNVIHHFAQSRKKESSGPKSKQMEDWTDVLSAGGAS